MKLFPFSRHFIVSLITAAAAITTGALPASADGFRNPPASVSGLGHSGGNLAFTEDASAIALNPANIAFANSAQLQAGTVLSIVDAEFSSSLGAPKADTRDSTKALPHAYVVAPISLGGQDVVLGFGVNVPYGRSSKWDSDATFSFSAPYAAELRTFDFKPTIATTLSDSVAVGAGLDIYYSDLELNQNVPWGMLTGLPTTLPGVSSTTADGWAVGANAGVTWDIAEGHRLAFIYRSAFTVDYDGDFSVTNLPAGELPPPVAAALSSESSFGTEIKYPHVFAVGYGATVTESVRVAVDFEYITASRFEEQPIDLGRNSILLPATVLEKDWDDNYTIGASADWNFAENWNGFIGYVYIESPIPDRTLSPLETDSDEHLISLGVSHTMDKNHFGFMYAFGILDDRTVTNNLDPTVNGEYEFAVQFVGLSYQRDL